MKRKLLICSALISVLLAGFQFPVFAEEDPDPVQESVPTPNSIRLDQYFYENYDLLPFVQSTSYYQYINSGIYASDHLKIEVQFSDFKPYEQSGIGYVFGVVGTDRNAFGCRFNNNNTLYFGYGDAGFNASRYDFPVYLMSHFASDNNVFDMNGVVHEFDEQEFTSAYPIYIFSSNNGGTFSNSGSCKIYKFSIYDNDLGQFVRYYYPARSKSGGVIGLYDAVSDTFVTTSGSVPFVSPVNDRVLNFQIGTFLTAGLGWIGNILEFAVETPIIMIFMAIGLAGAMFRWSRRLVHF